MNERHTPVRTVQRLAKSEIHKPGQEAHKKRHYNYPGRFVIRNFFPFVIPSVACGEACPRLKCFLWRNILIKNEWECFQTPRNRVQFQIPNNRWKHEAAGRLLLLFLKWSNAVVPIRHFHFKMLSYALFICISPFGITACTKPKCFFLGQARTCL